MLPPKDLIRLSKFLSLVLRHRPETLGITLDASGWTDVALLLQHMQAKGFAVDEIVLQEVVAHNSKQRFAFSADGQKIRASQGHSINVELGYQTQTPPDLLYHGTAKKHLPSILYQGLQKGQRHHVHLSGDKATALATGRRQGIPLVLQVDATRMAADGYAFFCSDNGVWLTEWVPPAYLNLVEYQSPH